MCKPTNGHKCQTFTDHTYFFLVNLVITNLVIFKLKIFEFMRNVPKGYKVRFLNVKGSKIIAFLN